MERSSWKRTNSAAVVPLAEGPPAAATRATTAGSCARVLPAIMSRQSRNCKWDIIKCRERIHWWPHRLNPGSHEPNSQPSRQAGCWGASATPLQAVAATTAPARSQYHPFFGRTSALPHAAAQHRDPSGSLCYPTCSKVILRADRSLALAKMRSQSVVASWRPTSPLSLHSLMKRAWGGAGREEGGWGKRGCSGVCPPARFYVSSTSPTPPHSGLT